VTFSPPNAIDSVAQFSIGGSYVLRLIVSDSALSGFDDHQVVVQDGEGPVVALTSPTDGASVTAPANVFGSVTSDSLQSWRLELRDEGQSELRPIASGTAPVDGGALGVLDPSLLLNGQYELRLTAVDALGRAASSSHSIVVEGNLKVGNFTVSFKDLSVPVAGIPIEVIRTYDSRDKRKGDFGVGWTLDIKSLRVQKNRVIGQSWETEVHFGVSGFGLVDAYCAVAGKRRYVTITFADGKVFRFEAKVIAPGSGWNGRRECRLGAPFSTATVEFQPLPGTHATLTRAGGTDVIVDASWPGEATLMSDDGSTLFDPDRFVVTLHDGRQLSVAQATGLERVLDTNGNTLEIRPGGLFHSSGQSVKFLRDPEGRIESIVDPEGHALSYEYDANDDLLAFTNAVSETTEYAYDGQHYLLGIVDPRGIQPITNQYDPAGRLLSHTDAFGNQIRYEHDLVNRRERVCDRLDHCTTHEYDDRGNVLSTTDPLGNATTYEYDDRDNKVLECNALGQCTKSSYDDVDNQTKECDPLDHCSEFTYDGRGNVVTTKDALGHVTTNEYDGRGNLLSTLDAAGNASFFEYDSRGLQTKLTDTAGHVTTYGYDTSGQLKSELDALGHATTHEYDARGNRLSQTTTRTIDGVVQTIATSYEYDAAGRLTQTTHPDGSVTRIEYDLLGQPTATIDALGRRTEREYDALGRLARTTFPDGSTEQAGYDPEGRRISSTDRGGRVTTFDYDSLGRLVTTHVPDGATTATTYDAAGRTLKTRTEDGSETSYSYDAAGRRTSVTDALSAITTSTYDDGGNQTLVVDPLGYATGLDYDALGRLVETSFADGTSEQAEYDVLGRRTARIDQQGRRTEYGYDAMGRLLNVKDALGALTEYTYDEQGNQLTQTDANGHATRFAYDVMGRRVGRALPAAGGITAIETMTYDAAGRLATKTDFMGRTTTMAYDVVDHLLSRTYSSGRSISFSYGASGRRLTATDVRGTTTYEYDTRDRLSSMRYPDGRELTYGYDSGGRRSTTTAHVAGKTLSTAWSYDAGGRMTSATDARSNAYSLGYDAAGHRTSLSQPNGTHTTSSYDSVGHLTSLITRLGSGPNARTIQSYSYTLAPTGIRTRVDEAGGIARNYTYDRLYRLTGETVTGTAAGAMDYTKSFTYDPVGNRLTQETTGYGEGTLDYSYDERDRLLAEAGAAHSWDANGNMLGKTGDDTFTWDEDDRLIRVVHADGSSVEHTYDVDGVRVESVEKAAGGTITRTRNYLVDTSGGLSQVVAETDSTGALIASYVRAGDQLLAVIEGAVVKQVHVDGLGSVRVLTAADGSVTDGYSYTAFGEALGWIGSSVQPYRFAGEEAEGGMQYHRARWYSPHTAGFVSPDPELGSANDPRSHVRYAYGGGTPQNLTDPTGRSLLALAATPGILDGLANLPRGRPFWATIARPVDCRFSTSSHRLQCRGGSGSVTALNEQAYSGYKGPLATIWWGPNQVTYWTAFGDVASKTIGPDTSQPSPPLPQGYFLTNGSVDFVDKSDNEDWELLGPIPLGIWRIEEVIKYKRHSNSMRLTPLHGLAEKIEGYGRDPGSFLIHGGGGNPLAGHPRSASEGCVILNDRARARLAEMLWDARASYLRVVR
jgi:RHS repeat-associated protein